MIRTIITPKNTDLHLSIPKDYVGKPVEILMYSMDEVHVESSPAKLRGKLNLTTDQYLDFNQYLTDTRNEWSRGI